VKALAKDGNCSFLRLHLCVPFEAIHNMCLHINSRQNAGETSVPKITMNFRQPACFSGL
jgi:hypothetical protein